MRLRVPSARASSVERESIRMVKVLGFIGLDGLSCVHVVRTWCKVGASGEGWQVRNAQKVRIGRKGKLESSPVLGAHRATMALDRSVTGRAKGTPNKLTSSIRDAIFVSFERLGGAAYLEEVARRDPRTYCALLGKVLPRNPAATDNAPGNVSTLSDAEIRQRVAGMLREGLSPAGIETGEVVDAVEVGEKSGT